MKVISSMQDTSGQELWWDDVAGPRVRYRMERCMCAAGGLGESERGEGQTGSCTARSGREVVARQLHGGGNVAWEHTKRTYSLVYVSLMTCTYLSIVGVECGAS